MPRPCARTNKSERRISARRSLPLLVVAVVVAAAFPAIGRASHWLPGSCGLPTTLPLSVEYSEIGVSPVIRSELFTRVQPPLVLATSGAVVPGELRAAGARTVFWYMKLERLVGPPATPADPATIASVADRMFARAVEQSGCATPVIALNELFGASRVTPWTPNYAQYRSNVLLLLQRLHALGARPFLLVVTRPRPFTDTPEAVAWWTEVAAVSDIVLQVHFNGRYISNLGVIAASRTRREKMRAVLAQFEAIGVPHTRLGLLHGFQSGSGGRTGLPLSRWLRVVKWEVLATKQVIAERSAAGTPLASDWSWGWGDFPALSPVDPDKHVTACAFLWARNPLDCDAPARAASVGVSFNTSLTEGQLALPPNVQCAVVRPRGAVFASDLERLSAAKSDTGVPVGRRAALATLFARVVERQRAVAWPSEIDRAERVLVETRFGGAWQDYEAALAQRNLTYDDARAVIADQVRRRKITAQLRPRRMSFRRWSANAWEAALAKTTCLADALPSPSARSDLSVRFGFLRVA